MRTIFQILILLIVFNLNAQNNQIPTQVINGIEYYQYTVQPGEGLYRISKNFGTSQSEINNVNPQIHDGLQAGMEILIPVVKDFKPQINPTSSETTVRKTLNYINHVVEKKQTVFAICQLHGISQEDFRKANPEITKTKLKSGEIVKIPIFILDTIPAASETIVNNSLIKLTKNQNLKIAFMLPFMLNQNKTDLAVKRFVEFYSGAIIALQEFKEKGYTLDIYTYDTEKSESKLAQILEDSTLLQMDLIIGPAYSSQVSMMGDFARTNKLKTIIPFTSKIIDLTSNPWLFQFNPGQDIELKNIVDYLSSIPKEKNIVFFQTEQSYVADENYNLMSQLQQILTEKKIQYQIEIINDSLEISSNLPENITNVLFFNTGKISQVSKELKVLKRVGKDSLDILVYEPLSWKNSKTEKPNTFSYSPFKKDFDIESYSNYQVEYIKLFGSMPDESLPRYDLIGYDIVKYAIPNIISTNDLGKKIELKSIKGLQSDIKFVRTHTYSGFINEQMNLIKTGASK